MVVKTITITESAYDSLAASKSEKESFSEVIIRITQRRSMLDFAGCMKGKEGEDFEKAVLEGRKAQRKLQQERAKRLWG